MKNNKNHTFYSICIIFLFLLSGCTVIGNTNLPHFSAVEDSENVIVFYKDNNNNYNENNHILFFNTKTEKITQEWDFEKEMKENGSCITESAEPSIINNEVYFSLNNKCYHIKKDTGKNISLECSFTGNIKNFFDDTVLLEEDSSYFIYNPKIGSSEKIDFDYNYYYSTNFFTLGDERYLVEYDDIYSYKTKKKVYTFNQSDDYESYNIDFHNNTNFYTVFNAKKDSDEDIETTVTTKELREIIIDENGDFTHSLVAALEKKKSVLTLFKNSETEVAIFEKDDNNYLYISIFTRKNGTWSEREEKITKDNKIKIYSSWIKEQNGAYWLINMDDNIVKINKNDFKTEETKL